MDKLSTWFVFAIAAFVLWGLWGFFAKLTTGYINPKSALIWETVGVIIVSTVILPMVSFKPETHPKGVLFAILMGAFAMLGSLVFLFAVSKGKASVVVTMTALYPLVVILLSYFILHEAITIKQGIGIVFALIAMILFA